MGGRGGVGVAIGVDIGAFHSPPLAVSLAAAIVAGSYLLARTIFPSVVRRRSAQLNGLLDRMAVMIPPAEVP